MSSQKTLVSYYGSADNILNAATENFQEAPEVSGS